MNLVQRIKAFSQLGDYIRNYLFDNLESKSDFDIVLLRAEQQNPWFTQQQLRFALEQWAGLLQQSCLEQWVSDYRFSNKSYKIGVVQAGNLPLVGFHDFLSVLISGHCFVGKVSSKDSVLPCFLSDILIQIEPDFKPFIQWTDRIKEVDAIIATGSDNAARYFEYYFANKPNIIRKNRSSCAILTGQESRKDLELLGEDIFKYYGLGCRNVSKLWVPKAYDFAAFFEAIEPYRWVYQHHKYANNFDYNHSVYLLNQEDFLQNGFMILKQNLAYHSPLSVLFYEYYTDVQKVCQRIEQDKSKIQCVADMRLATPLSVKFGQTQKPKLNQYADQIDILEWLANVCV